MNVFPSQIEELILKAPALAPHYQLVVTRDGHLDKLEVRVEARPEWSASLTADDRAALERELKDQIKTYVGVTTRVQVVAAEGIERTTVGKARRVVDMRPKVTHEQPVGAI
ncbi:Phenylacetate-coenzyme A ligase [compost metagenome]